MSEDNGVIKSSAFELPERFAAINKMIMRDMNGRRVSPTFYKYTKDQIATYLKDPYTNEKALRDAVIYMYSVSSHFRRLIQYFVGLSDLSYVVSPAKIDTNTAKPATIRRNYRRVLNLLSAMDIRNQFEKILTVCLREDIFYGTIRESADNTIIQQLPSDYCAVSVIEDNVLNVTFNFSYFDTYGLFLQYYPEEFQKKYELYRNDRTHMKWQELDTPNSFAIKANKDVLNYATPPFAGILRALFDLEDYQTLKLSKAQLENYALLVMNLGIDDDGNWVMDYEKAKKFWMNLDGVLPEEVGSVLSPMPIDKISFERSHTGDTDTIAEAEQNLFTEAGVSSLLFNNEKASSNALLLSIKADQAMTYSIVKSLECMLNRFVHRHNFGKYFRVCFLDCSPFNRKEVGDSYLKACQYGLPFISFYAASQGMMQDDVDCMSFLETDVLNLTDRFKPLQNSATLSKEETSGEAGRPKSDATELTDDGEDTREQEINYV